MHGSIQMFLMLAGLSVIGLATAQAADPPGDEALPLTKLVLFNSGVGYYEHQTTVDGRQRIELKFDVGNINDLLKSMVLQDLGGGHVATVTYASKDPITKTLGTFAIDLTSNPSLADLLEQVRGEQVELDAPDKIAGLIVGVERRQEATLDGKLVTPKAYLNLLTDAGLRSVALSTVSRIKLVNVKLDSELRQALAVLAMGHSTDKKAVTLDFVGEGKRPVRVGYVQEAPIWKTSYRLVLDDKKGPQIQGWAIVENTTEHDWTDVRLTLVSGRPISFVMNLYDPLYLPRPVVEPELFASLRPQTYDQDLKRKEGEFAALREPNANRRLALANAAPAATPGYGMGGGLGGGMGGAVDKLERKAGVQMDAAASLGEDRDGIEVQQGVLSAATGGDVGELFQYVINAPVTLPRRQSALLPIVQDAIQGEKVSIYNRFVQEKHPLSGLRLKNTTGLHLMQGPITVFDGGIYAGDSRIEDLSPGSERLLSYSLDLDTEVATDSQFKPDVLTSVKIYKGLMTASRKYERTTKYTIKNSGSAAKNVLIEQQREPIWKLTGTLKPAEQTRERYRFAVSAKPGVPEKLDVAEEQLIQQQFSLTNFDDNSIRFYLDSKVVSAEVKAALTEVVRQKHEMQRLEQQKVRLNAEITAIDQEQTRIRQNMEQLARESDLYARYVKKFSSQEDQIERDRQEVVQLDQQLDTLRKKLDDYLEGLDV